MVIQASEKDKWTKGLQVLNTWIKQKKEEAASKQQSGGTFSWLKKITGGGNSDSNKKVPAGEFLNQAIDEINKQEEMKLKTGEQNSSKKAGQNSPRKTIIQDLELQLKQYIKRLEQLEEQNSTKDETIALLVDEKKALIQNKYELMDELRAEKEYSSKIMAERNRFEKESHVALNEKLKVKAENLENENAALSNSVKELEQQKDQAERKIEMLEKNVERLQGENLGYSREMESMKADKLQQAMLLNQQFSEIEKLRNQVASLEQEVQEKEKYINTILPDLNKETEENEQLRKQIEAVKDAQEKLAEEKKNSLEKSNQISDLELKIKDAKITLKETQLKTMDALEEVEKIRKDREQEKLEFANSLTSVKDAIEALVRASVTPSTADLYLSQTPKDEEELTTTLKTALKGVPDLYFIFDIYYSMREKVQQLEEKVKNLEEKLTSVPIVDENQVSKLEKELADEKELTQSLNTQLFNAQRESTQKTQMFLDKVNEFSLQFNMLIKSMFLYNKQRRTSLSFATQLEMFSREYPQMKNIQELYGFLRETVKKDLDQTKVLLQQKSQEIETLQEKINELQAESDNSENFATENKVFTNDASENLSTMPEKEFGLLLQQLIKSLIESGKSSEEHLSLLSRLDDAISTQRSREYGKNIYELVAKRIASSSEEAQRIQNLTQKDLGRAKSEETEKQKTQKKSLPNKTADENNSAVEKEKTASRDSKKEQDLVVMSKEREQLLHRLRQDISNIEEFCLQFSLLFREVTFSSKLNLAEVKRREDALRTLVEGHVKVEELLKLLALLEDHKQKTRNESGAVMKELKAENETLIKENKHLEKQNNTLKTENEAIKQKHFIQAQVFEAQNAAIKAGKKVLAKVEEYNKILYFVIRESQGEGSNSGDFYTMQDRKSRLKQLSDGIPELHILNELYIFLTNERIRTKPSPQKNKESSPEPSRRISAGTMLSPNNSSQKFGGPSHFKKSNASTDKLGLNSEGGKLRPIFSGRNSSPTNEHKNNGSPETTRIQPDQERSSKGKHLKTPSNLRVTSDDLKRAVRISEYLSTPK